MYFRAGKADYIPDSVPDDKDNIHFISDLASKRSFASAPEE